MKILSLKAINFMSYESLEINFEAFDGITLISGANGSGKSTLFEAITWGLFGKTLRNMAANDVIRDDADACEVWITVDTSQGMFQVKRRRMRSGGSTLQFGNMNSGTTSGKQKDLELGLNCDFKYFVNTVMFGGRASSFCNMTDSERKKILEELMGFDLYARGYKKAHDDKLSYELRLERLESDLVSLRNSLTIHTENLERYQSESSNFRRKWHMDLLYLEKELDELNTEEHEIIQDLIKEYIANKDIQESFAKQHAEYNAKINKLRERQKQITTRLQEVLSSIAAIKERMSSQKQLIQQKKKFNEIQESGICPTCGQILPRNYAKQHTAIKPLEDSYDEMESHYRELVQEESILSTEIKKISREFDEIKEPSKPDYAITSKLKIKLSSNRSRQRTLKYRIKKQYKDTKNPFIAMIKNTRAKIKNIESKIKEVQSDIAETKENFDIAAYFEKAFHYNGIPAYLLDNILPVIMEFSENYADILTDGELSVDFSYTNSGKLALDIDYSTGSNTYEAASTGEKTRADLVILFAIRDAIENMYKGNKFHQIFLDEVFNGLDERGTEAVMTVLRKNFEDKQVFLITHDTALKSYADHTIEVFKDGFSSKCQ